MPLTRTGPLARRSVLRRTPFRRKPTDPTATPPISRRRRSTGPTRQTREAVHDRSGHRCERCGVDLRLTPHGRSVHHRRPRGMGGTTDPAINSPANLLDLSGTGTTGCHGWVEANRRDATATGFLVPRGVDPTEWPVEISDRAGRHVWVYLTHDADWILKEFG